MHKNGTKQKNIFQLAILSTLCGVGPMQSTDNGHTMHSNAQQSASTGCTSSKHQADSVDVKHSLISFSPCFPVFTD